MTTTQPPAAPLFSALRAPTSFSAHRRNRTAMDDSEEDKVALSMENASVYRIPQRTGRAPTAPPPTPVTARAPPPRMLALASNSVGIAAAPLTAPVRSRMSGTAASRGISLDFAVLSKSIPRGVSTAGSGRRGWPPSPTKTPTSAGFPRARGLTVAILKGNGELIAESAPVTPSADGLKSQAQMQTQGPTDLALTPAPSRALELVSSPGLQDAAAAIVPTPATPRVQEKILCRFYHTAGLSCTSSPCRFIHKIEMPQSSGPGTAPYSAIPSLSPHKEVTSSPDPTSGTFAAAQARVPLALAQPELLTLSGNVTNITAGDAVALDAEHVGFVYKMSGGGKGPAGKSRQKYRTVPCKDYATGSCGYGDDYCSFIHDDNNLYDEEKHGKKDKPKDDTAANKLNSPGSAIPPRTPYTPRTPSYPRVNGKASPLASEPVNVNNMQVSKRSSSVTSSKLKTVPRSRANNYAVEASPPADAILTPTLDNSTDVIYPPYSSLPAPRLANPPRRQRNIKIVKKDPARVEAPPLARVATTTLTPLAIETPMTEMSDPAAAWDPADQHAQQQAQAHAPAGQQQDIPPNLEAYAEGVEYPHNMGYYSWSPEWHGGAWFQPALYAVNVNVGANTNDSGSPLEPSALADDHSPLYQYPMSPHVEQEVMLPDGSYMQPTTPAFSPTYRWNGSGPGSSEVGFHETAMPSPVDRSPFTSLGLNGVPFPALDETSVPYSPRMPWSPPWSQSSNYGLGINGLRSPEFNTSRQYWRTRPCQFWIKSGGRECPQGDSCCFQHVFPPSSRPPARAHARGHSQPRTKTMACKFFNSKEGCTRRDVDCPFAHIKVVPNGQEIEPKPYRTHPCRHFQQGRCVLGSACHFAHVADSTAKKGTTAPPVTPATPFILTPIVAPHARTFGGECVETERSNSAPAFSAASAMHGASLVAAAFDASLACPEWTATGRCAREWCTARHEEGDVEGAAMLTEVSLAAACEILRAKASEQSSAVESDSDDDDDDELEIVTNTHSRSSTRSSRSV